MTANPDPTNPNAVHFNKPYAMPRPMMRKQTLAQKIRGTQARLTGARPAKVTLPELPEGLRKE